MKQGKNRPLDEEEAAFLEEIDIEEKRINTQRRRQEEEVKL